MPISSTGVGSGLDVESIVTQLMAIERRPVTLLQNAATDLKAQLSSFGQMQSYMSAFRDKANALTSTTLWGQTVATASDTTAVSVSTGSSASAGSYSISVSKLAASQTVTSTAFAASTSVVGEGSLSIELGTWSGDPATAFSAKAGSSPVSITIGPTETSLASIRDKINAAGAGVTASIVNDASGARLSLRSTSTGAENGFRVTATETVDDGNPATGLSALGYNGEGLSPMSLNQKALNAEAKINGIDIVSASNTLANVADGLTVKLLKTTTSAVDVSVTQDTDAVKTAINGFVSAYNDLNGFIRTQTKYNPDSKVAGTLQGDRTAVGLQNQLRSVLRDSSTASALYTRFSDVGIEIQKDGSLQVKAAKLTDALGNLADLRKVLASTDDSTATSTGIVQRFKLFADQVLDTDGALQTRTDGLNLSVKLNSQRQDALNSRMDETEKRLRAQYQTLDANMAKLSQLSGYVNQQLSSLRFNNNNN
jgi:flagellar hook-associated protein 2